MAEKQEIELKVAKAMPEDAEKGIVRMDSKSMKQINVAPGDVVELEGKRKTVAVAAKAYPSDVGMSVVRMDGILRRNSGGSIGEHIQVRKADVSEAEKVVLAPAQKGIQVQVMGSGLEKSLMGRPVMKGDIISPIRAQPRQKDPFSDLFSSAFEPMFGFANLRLMVVSTKPKGPVVITDMTQIQINPSAVETEEIGKIPQVTYEDIGGLGEEISKVREMIELPLKHPELFEKLGIEPPKGVLLYGPPGTGKTLLAKAVANETNSNFMLLNGPEIMSKWYGESEKRLRQIFEDAEKNAPTIVFIDEIDAIAPKREEVRGEVERRVVATLLSQMDGLKSRGKVVVIAATNRADALDPALRRGGRFDREIEIGVPDRKGRKEVLQIHTRAMPLDKDVNLDKWADITYGYVGADLEALVKEAAMAALRRTLPKLNLDEETEIPAEVMENLRVKKKDFKVGLRNVSPSAMREVMVEIPRVSWKEVGGLENVKQELIEAVEWPLKKPNAFKNLGIHPPKGVLLYGPPGTGKTLLAKAVANESNANFILVRGPELLSKWVGESLPADEEILTIENNMLKRTEIGAFVDKNIDKDATLSVPTVTDDFKAKNSKVNGFFRHKAPAYIDVITTETGRKIRVTGGHSLFIKDNEDIMEITANAIEAGKTKIAIPRKLVPVESIKSINFLNSLEQEDYGLFVCNGQDYIKKAYEKLGRKKASKVLNIAEKNVGHYSKRAAMRASKFIKLMKAAGIKYNAKELKITAHIRTHKIPAVVNLDKEFSTFLGIWIAEGSYMKHGVRVSLSTKESGRIIKLCNKLFGHVTTYSKGNGTDVLICSTALKVLMKNVLKMQGGAKNKRVPAVIFSAPKTSISAFLRGYMSGDGYFSGKYIETSTVSKELANDLLMLFLYFGIVARCREKVEWNGSISYRVRFLWSGFLREFVENIGFIDPKKHNLVKKYINNLKLKRVLQSPEQNIDGDIYWDLVVKKERTQYKHPFVYDIGVNPTERFVAGFGGVFVHNSERGVRKIFKKARQVAPSIIFFDELDALAPKRGSHTGSHVTETVVNQLLTELDGLEELENVVVIASTNRPDVIDPGLLRPGRFDRHILTPVPDKEARKNIFEVHTKGMPLSKDVNLNKLVDMTENFVGADIEALCREAAMRALRKNMSTKKVTMSNFKDALENIYPTMNEELIQFYEEALKNFRQRAPAAVQDKPRYLG